MAEEDEDPLMETHHHQEGEEDHQEEEMPTGADHPISSSEILPSSLTATENAQSSSSRSGNFTVASTMATTL